MAEKAILEVRMQSGREFHFLGTQACRVMEALLSNSRAPISAMWGSENDPNRPEVTMERDYVECYVWYANGRP